MSNCIPDTLYAKIRVKRSLVPNEKPSNLDLGELAVNIPDRKIYVGNQSGNPVLITGSGGTGNGIYSAGAGITISASDEISFNPNTIPDKTIPTIKLAPPPGQLISGYLYFNGTGWELGTGLSLSSLFNCIGGTTGGQYFIDGGNASSATYCSP